MQVTFDNQRSLSKVFTFSGYAGDEMTETIQEQAYLCLCIISSDDVTNNTRKSRNKRRMPTAKPKTQ